MKQEIFQEKLKKALELAPPNVMEKVANIYFTPTFCNDHEFFYCHESFEDGEKIKKYILVNMEDGDSAPLFDHIILAKKLSDHLGKKVNYKKLPISQIQKKEYGIEFEYEKNVFLFDGKVLIHKGEAPLQKLVVSPDGKYGAYTQNDNLYIRVLNTGECFPLTDDGIPHFGYAGVFEGNENIIRERLINYIRPAGVIWSPDSKRLLTYRIDERLVKELYLIQNVPQDEPVRPVLHTYKYALPQDEHVAMAELFICDVETKEKKQVLDNILVDLSEPFNGGFTMAAWSDEGNSLIAWRMDRGHKNAEIFKIDADTGIKTKLFTESSNTFLFFDFYRSKFGSDPRYDKNAVKQMWYSERLNRLLWISDRDGYFHVYSINTENPLECRQITKGSFNVRNILRAYKERLYISAAGYEEGSSPYKMKAYECDINSGELSLLTPDEHEHIVQISPDGKYLLDNFSTFDEPPMVVIRNIKGKYIATVLKADIAPLDDMGISYPFPFIEKGDDGETDIYGLMLMPYGFDPKNKYPVIDYYYGGNQTTNVPTNFHDYLNKGYLNSLSELGFVVVIIDGHGTPFRSKEFHDACHKNVASCCGMEDHVAVIHNLCEKYSFMNEDKIAVWGHSGGGFAAYKCMVNYPDTYKCAMASGGNHMQELYISAWGERFMNEYDKELWKSQNSEFDACKLQGPLMLIHGELDDNVHPASTMRLVNALIKADKDFDFLIMPNKHHLLSTDKYYQKKVLSFFAKHML